MIRQFGSCLNYKWYVVGLLWFVCLLNYADRQAIFSVFPLLKSEMHLTDVQLGVLGASFMWVYALLGPFAGRLCDRLARKTLIIGALLLWSLATAASALSHSYMELIAYRALTGLGEVVYLPASMSLMSDFHGTMTRSRALSLHQSSVYVGTILGGGLSGWIAEQHGWRAGFLFFGLAGVLWGVVLISVLREPARGQSETTKALQASATGNSDFWTGARDVCSSRGVLLLIAAFIGANFVAVVFLAWMPAYLYNRFHMSLGMAGLTATIYLQMASIPGVLFGGLVADKLAFKNKMKVNGRVFTQALGLFCGVPFLFIVGSARSMAVLSVSMLALGFCKGVYDSNIFASLYDLVKVNDRGLAAGLLNSVGWLGGGAAPVVIAIASTRYGMGAGISATAVIYLATAAMLFLAAGRLAQAGASQLSQT
jgi:MFS family permease